MLMNIGDKARFVVYGRDDSNREVELPGALSFVVTDPEVCSVTSDGVVTAESVGSTTIVASINGLVTQAAAEVRSKTLTKIGGVLQRI